MSNEIQNSKNEFHIAFGVDKKFFYPMGVTITSIIHNNPELYFVFHVFSPCFTTDDVNKLKMFEIGGRHKIMMHLVDDALINVPWDFRNQPHYSPAIFTRIFIPKALHGITDRVLYLDADILCHGNIAELLDLDMEGVVASAVCDVDKVMQKRCNALNIQGGKYFNSGVLYINIKKWMEGNITEEVLRCIAKNINKLTMPDQDALNIVLEGKIKFMNRKWNSQFFLVGEIHVGNNRFDAPSDAVFIHYTGWLKPWSSFNLHESRKLFLQYRSISPWKNEVFPNNNPKNYKEMHLCALMKMRNGQLIGGLNWYSKYLLSKYFRRVA